MKLGPVTIDTGNMSPTTWFGAVAAAGLAIVGAQVVYPSIEMPHGLLTAGVVMATVGTALKGYFAADNSDIPKPPSTEKK